MKHWGLQFFITQTAVLATLALLSGCAQIVTVTNMPPEPPAVFAEEPEPAWAAGLERAPENDLAKSIGAHLDMAHAALEQLAENPADPEARELYSYAMGRIAGEISVARLDLNAGFYRAQGKDQEWLVNFRTDRPEVPLSRFEILPVDTLRFGGSEILHNARRDGIGAPVVAVALESVDVPGSDGRSVELSSAGRTAVGQFNGNVCTLELLDPTATKEILLAGRQFPVAANFTAPLAVLIDRHHPQRLGRIRLLRPEKFRDTAGLARLQTYDPQKIPVVFVHGLQDTPVTWLRMVNELLLDEEIRRRYQFWVFSYPSGYPFPYSAHLLREELDELAELYPDKKDMVLIGHSMGGLLSRLMVTDTGDYMWNRFFSQPPEALPVSEELREFLVKVAFFETRDDVARVIYISTPHRGSEFATNWIGRLGSMLVVLPDILGGFRDLLLDVLLVDQDAMNLHRLPNSIDTLSPNSRILLALDQLPPDPAIPFHTIAGDRGRGDGENSSDGIVPYWSSHLDGAQSELIVPSGHGAHKHPQGIDEVRRILLQHAN